MGTPTFRVLSSRSVEEPPTVRVKFANGLEYDFDLTHYKMNEASPVGCNYIGRLHGDSTSSVAVTGCLNKPDDRFQVTLLSRHSKDKMFFLDYYGNAEVVQRPFHDGGITMAKISSR